MVRSTAMNFAAIGSTHDWPKSDFGHLSLKRGDTLNVEMFIADPLRRMDRKSEIRFNAAGAVTIVLGMRDHGRGWYSSHFASLVSHRLGVPFRRIRVYYSETLPAVLQTPQECRILPEGSRSGPPATAVGDLIETMCGRVVESGKTIFAKCIGATPSTVEFDQAVGRFFELDGGWSAGILDIARVANPPASMRVNECDERPSA